MLREGFRTQGPTLQHPVIPSHPPGGKMGIEPQTRDESSAFPWIGRSIDFQPGVQCRRFESFTVCEP